MRYNPDFFLREQIKRRRQKEQAAQGLAGRRVLWATVLIQAVIARGPIGRKRFVQRQDDLIAAREVRRNKSATKIQVSQFLVLTCKYLFITMSVDHTSTSGFHASCT